jgi:hypothetical protein
MPGLEGEISSVETQRVEGVSTELEGTESFPVGTESYPNGMIDPSEIEDNAYASVTENFE